MNERAPDKPESSCGLSQPARSLDLGVLVREHTVLVERALLRYGVAERDLPDARQEVFLVVLRKLAGFEHRSLVSTWLYRIAVRVASQYRRSAYHRREALTAEPAADGAAEEDALAALERRYDLALALRALERLDDAKREVLVLHELEGLSMSAIAGRLRCPLKTAFSRLYAARRTVLDELRRQGVVFGFLPPCLPLRASLRIGRAFSGLGSGTQLSWQSLGMIVACALLPSQVAQRDEAPAAARAIHPVREPHTGRAKAALANNPVPPDRTLAAPRAAGRAVPKTIAARNRLGTVRVPASLSSLVPSESSAVRSGAPIEPEPELTLFRASDRDLRPRIASPLASEEQPSVQRRTRVVLRDPIDPAERLESELGSPGL